MMEIVTIPLNSDNFGYLVICKETNNALFVDVSNNPDQVFSVVNEYKVNLKTVLSTHKHWDHSGVIRGNDKLKELIPGIEVCGHEIDQCEGCTRFVNDGEEFDFDTMKIQCLHTPGHTQGHICYYIRDGERKAVFTGDILFRGGAGRFFEGSADDAFLSFQKIMSLPEETEIYCGHEYTIANYRFALTVDGENSDLVEANENAKAAIEAGQHTVPSTVGLELCTNPFVRVAMNRGFDEIKMGLGKAAENISNPVALLAALRESKNKFK